MTDRTLGRFGNGVVIVIVVMGRGLVLMRVHGRENRQAQLQNRSQQGQSKESPGMDLHGVCLSQMQVSCKWK